MKILFLGSKSIGAQILGALLDVAQGAVCGAITIDDRSDSRSAFDRVGGTAAAASVPLHVAEDRKHADALVRDYRPDLCLAAGWYWLVTPELLAQVPRGFIGIHNSLLPKYRGGAPLVWALINGETEVGASVFSFSTGIDDGPVWCQARVSVGPDDYIGDVLERVERETTRVFRVRFPQIVSGRLSPVAQNTAEATYCSQRHPDDGEIDWSRPAVDVFNFIRAQSVPYPGAFTVHEGERLTIVRARRVPHSYYGTPGQVAELHGDSITVACGGASALCIDLVSHDGRLQTPAQLIRTIRTRFPRVPRAADRSAVTTLPVEPWR